ncbi:MAG: hypothetical protein ACFFBL_11440, partial [Promethearchaeota archaeon]
MGSITQAPTSVEVFLVVTPVVVLDIIPTSDMFIGHYCTVDVSVRVLGTNPEWSGMLDALLSDPDGERVDQRTFHIGIYSIVTIGFNARVEGTHNLNVTISGLPVVMNREYPMAITVVNETLHLQLDAGTTPLLGGFGILAAIGVVLRKKMKGVVDSLPGEWND